MFGTVPPQRVDQFNLRQCAIVIGVFGVITIISYFNELAKAGLLGKDSVYRYPRQLYKNIDSTGLVQRGAAVQNGGEVRNADSSVESLKNILRNSTTRKNRSTDDVLSVSLHLGKDHAYETSNSTRVNIFQHKNTVPNYFLSLVVENASICIGRCEVVGAQTVKNVSSCLNQNGSTSIYRETKGNIGAVRETDIQNYILHNRRYLNATKVFLYQHELAGYSVRDCFKVKAAEAGLDLLTSPINQNYRSEWEMLPSNKRNRYAAMYGGVAFGVCETLSRPCLYFTTMVHPLDRILQVYFYCRESDVNSLCTFSRTNHTDTDMYSFIKNSGNTYFKKLLYYSKHCRLVGNDQVCIQDSRTSFILSTAERKVLLADILKNLDKWFAVVGLVEHYKDSLKLFEHVLGIDFTKCDAFNHTSILKYLPADSDSSFVNESRKLHKSIKSMREKLLADPKIVQWLYADLKIYQRMEEIYQKQWDTYLRLKRHNLTGKHLSRRMNAAASNHAVAKSRDSTQIVNATYAAHANVRKFHGKTTYKIKDQLKAKKKALKLKQYVHKMDQSQQSLQAAFAQTPSADHQQRRRFESVRSVNEGDDYGYFPGYESFSDPPKKDLGPGRHKQFPGDYAYYRYMQNEVLSRDNDQQPRDIKSFDLKRELQLVPKAKLKRRKRIFRNTDSKVIVNEYADHEYGADYVESGGFVYD